MMEFQKIKENWAEYRCRPDVMIMADLYGHSSTENIQFCLKNGFDTRAMSFMKPFFTFMASFVAILGTLLQNLNSLRMIFATIIGTITQVFSEFAGRIKALTMRIQYTVIRMRMLMGRVFGMMYAVIFMGMSGIKAGQNFSNTFLFRFLDTFCFDPDTAICVKGKGVIPIKEVKVGDELEGAGHVTATFQFMADGQPMVYLPGNILVSTNHYVQHEGAWIQAVDHPLAEPADDWNGGSSRPLICLNTSTHTIPLGNFLFRDYDETEAGDQESMAEVLRLLNNKVPSREEMSTGSTMAVAPSTVLRMADGTLRPASSVHVGERLSTGTVIGTVKKLTEHATIYKGELFAPGTCVWDDEKNSWRRAEAVGFTYPLSEPTEFYSFFVTPGARIETEHSTIFRDYMEIHDPALETPYAAALTKQSEHVVKAEC